MALTVNHRSHVALACGKFIIKLSVGCGVLATDYIASYSEFCCSRYCMYLILMYILAEYVSIFINFVYASIMC